MNSFRFLPVPPSINDCNPLSIRIYKKKYLDEIIDGGGALCRQIDAELNINSEKEANWLLTCNSIFYVHPQSLTIREFSFQKWGLSSHLGLFAKQKKKKGLSCIRIFKVNKPLEDRGFLHDTFKKNNDLESIKSYITKARACIKKA